MWRPPGPPYPGYPSGYYQAPPPPANNMDLASAAEHWAMMQAANHQAQTEHYAFPPQPQYQPIPQQQFQYAGPPSYTQPMQQPPWPAQAPQGLLPPPTAPYHEYLPTARDHYADPLERNTTGLLGHAPPADFSHQDGSLLPSPLAGYSAPPAMPQGSYTPPGLPLVHQDPYIIPQAHQAQPGQFQAQPGLPAGVHPHFQQAFEPPPAIPPRPPLPVDPTGNQLVYQPYVAPDGIYHDVTGGYPYQYDYSNMVYHPGFDFESVAQSHNAEAIKKLPPWLREGLEKLEREKQKEREKQRFMQEYEAKIKEESSTSAEKSGKASKFDSSPSRSRSNSPVEMIVESEKEESEEEDETWDDEIRRLTLIQATKDIVTSVLMNATTRVLETTCTAEIEARKIELNKASRISGKTGGLAAFLGFAGSDTEEDDEDGQPPPPPKGAIKGASTAQKSIDTPVVFGGIKLGVASSPSPSPEREKKEVKSNDRPFHAAVQSVRKSRAGSPSNGEYKGRGGNDKNGSASSSKRTTSQRQNSRRSSSSSSESSSERNRSSKKYRSPEPKPEKKRVSRWNRSPEDDRKEEADRKESSRREEERTRERSRERPASKDTRENRPSLKRSDSTRSGKSTSSASKSSGRGERRRSDSRSNEDISRRKRSQRYS